MVITIRYNDLWIDRHMTVQEQVDRAANGEPPPFVLMIDDEDNAAFLFDVLGLNMSAKGYDGRTVLAAMRQTSLKELPPPARMALKVFRNIAEEATRRESPIIWA